MVDIFQITEMEGKFYISSPHGVALVPAKYRAVPTNGINRQRRRNLWRG